MSLRDFISCKAVYNITVYRYTYVTDFVNVRIELLIIELKGTNNKHIGNPTEYI